MKTASCSDLRRNLSGLIDQVNADHEPVLITCGRGKPSAVLMLLEDYASFEETRHLLASPKTLRVCSRPSRNWKPAKAASARRPTHDTVWFLA